VSQSSPNSGSLPDVNQIRAQIEGQQRIIDSIAAQYQKKKTEEARQLNEKLQKQLYSLHKEQKKLHQQYMGQMLEKFKPPPKPASPPKPTIIFMPPQAAPPSHPMAQGAGPLAVDGQRRKPPPLQPLPPHLLPQQDEDAGNPLLNQAKKMASPFKSKGLKKL